MTTRRTTSSLATTMRTRCIDIRRERDTSSPFLPTVLPRQKARVLLVQVMPRTGWPLEPPAAATLVRSFSFLRSFRSLPLVYSFMYAHGTYVYEQCNSNEGALSKSQQTPDERFSAIRQLFTLALPSRLFFNCFLR